MGPREKDFAQMIKFVRDEVLGFVDLEVLPRTLKPHNALQITADFILRKTTRSLKAICELCLSGYGEDAQILGRTIFELSLTLAFITKPSQTNGQADISSEELAELYVLHGSEEQVRMQQRISKIQKLDKCKEWNVDLSHENAAEADYKKIIKDYLALRGKLINY